MATLLQYFLSFLPLLLSLYDALAVSLIVPRSFRSFAISFTSFAVSRIAIVVSNIARANSSNVPFLTSVCINCLVVDDDSRISPTFFIDSALRSDVREQSRILTQVSSADISYMDVYRTISTFTSRYLMIQLVVGSVKLFPNISLLFPPRFYYPLRRFLS